MKRISTLFAIAVLLTVNSFSQNVSQSFESQEEVNSLSASCWAFNNVSHSTNSPLSGTGSVVGTLGSMSEIITPELQIPASLIISFGYNTVATSGGSKTLKIFIMIGASKTLLETINLNSNASGNFSGTYTNANTPGNNINGSRSIVIEVNNNASVKIDDLTINADYTYAGGCNVTLAPLPIKLLSFSGNLVNNKAQLKWSVDENETGDRFQVEKSADGRNFSGAGIVFVSTKTGIETYTFHEALELTTESYYRLKIINKDNSISSSRIIALKNGKANGGNAITILQNPVRSTAAFNYTTALAGIYDVSIYNAAGLKVYTSKVNCQKGINALSFGMDRYNTGTYVLEVSNDSGKTVTKLMKQ